LEKAHILEENQAFFELNDVTTQKTVVTSEIKSCLYLLLQIYSAAQIMHEYLCRVIAYNIVLEYRIALLLISSG
jgi:hypothetical protein